MDRPLRLVAQDERETEELEVEALRELMTAAAKGADRLPSGSPWRQTCVEVQRTCARSLARRGKLIAALAALPIG